MLLYESYRDYEIKPIEAFKTEGCNAHFHSSIEILFVKEGKIDILINGKSSVLTKGEILICNSYDVHAYSVNAQSDGYVIILPKNLLSDFNLMLRNKTFKNNIINDAKTFQNLITIYDMLIEYNSKKQNYCSDALGKSLFAIVLSKIELIDKNLSSNDSIKEVLFYIYNNLSEPLTLKSLSTRFGYSPNHFSYIFNSYMKTNLTTFINNLRAQKSLEYIKSGQSVIEASENAGFPSLRTFYRSFKSNFNTSPIKFIKQLNVTSSMM